MDYGSRMPLHFQDPEIAKAANPAKDNPSFRADSQQVGTLFTDPMEGRAGAGARTLVRRYANGEADLEWAARLAVQAIGKTLQGGNVLQDEGALLTVLFPDRYRYMEPKQAELWTQLSPSEKAQLKERVEAALREIQNYSGGAGGGSVPGRAITLG